MISGTCDMEKPECVAHSQHMENPNQKWMIWNYHYFRKILSLPHVYRFLNLSVVLASEALKLRASGKSLTELL